MLALVAAVVFAQSTISLEVGKQKQDSATKAKYDSIMVRREERRDSIMARARVRDSVRKATRLAKRPAITPAIIASAFKDARAKDLEQRG